jgi:hypothetical protein
MLASSPKKEVLSQWEVKIPCFLKVSQVFFFLSLFSLDSHLSPFHATIFPFCCYLLSCLKKSFITIQEN